MPHDHGVRGETHEGQERRPRQPDGHGAVESIVQPRTRARVLGRRLIGGIEQQVRVDQDHL
jgi:hypothetical protein